jgi:hypothetical protein
MGRLLDVMREYVAVPGGATGKVTHEGAAIAWRGSGLARLPAAPPILLAGLGPKMLELSGEIADGAVLWLCSPAYIRDQAIPAIRRGRQRAGKSMDGFEVVAAVPAALTVDRATGHALFKTELVRYLALPSRHARRQRLSRRASRVTARRSDAGLIARSASAQWATSRRSPRSRHTATPVSRCRCSVPSASRRATLRADGRSLIVCQRAIRAYLPSSARSTYRKYARAADFGAARADSSSPCAGGAKTSAPADAGHGWRSRSRAQRVASRARDADAVARDCGRREFIRSPADLSGGGENCLRRPPAISADISRMPHYLPLYRRSRPPPQFDAPRRPAY